MKAGKTLVFKSIQTTKIIAGVKVAAGLIEISSGVSGTLLKLADKNDSPLGRTITKYLVRAIIFK